MIRRRHMVGSTEVEYIDLTDEGCCAGITRRELLDSIDNGSNEWWDAQFAFGTLFNSDTEGWLFYAKRTLGVPARFAFQILTPTQMRIFFAHTIRDIANAWYADLPEEVEQCQIKAFDPRYTVMPPAFNVVKVPLNAMRGVSYTPLLTLHQRSKNLLDPDIALVGERYVNETCSIVHRRVREINSKADICIPFSGGVDSALVAIAVAQARQMYEHTGRLILATLCIDGGGRDAVSAQAVLPAVENFYLNTSWEKIGVASGTISHDDLLWDTCLTIEDYRVRDVECAMAGMVLLGELRRRHAALVHLFDGDGGNEFWEDYPLVDDGYGRISLKDVHDDPHLFYLGYPQTKLAYSTMYSGGLSRGYVRTFNTGRKYGFRGCSPLISGELIALSTRIPLADLAPTPQRLHEIRGEAVHAGVKQVYDVDLPIFPKARFQEGCASVTSPFHVTQDEAEQLKHKLLASF